jgi:hypothetical protein
MNGTELRPCSAVCIDSHHGERGGILVNDLLLEMVFVSPLLFSVCNLGALIAQVLGSFVMLVFLGLMTVATVRARPSATSAASCSSGMQGIAFSLLLIRVREERRSRLLQRMLGVVETPPPLRPHAIELTSKSSELA